MEIFFKIFLTIHVIAGIIGLFTGSINLVRKKGDKTHQSIGRIFTYGMITTGFSGLIMTLLHPSYFLFIVSIFTIYLIGTGNRYIHLKLLAREQGPKVIDWVLTIGMLLMGIAFLGLGITNLIEGNNFGIVPIAFGVIGLVGVKEDFTNYRGKSKTKNYWLLIHIGRMTGGYIAASTAFLVVNLKHLPINIPPTIAWLLPTAILTPLIFVWTRKHKVK